MCSRSLCSCLWSCVPVLLPFVAASGVHSKRLPDRCWSGRRGVALTQGRTSTHSKRLLPKECTGVAALCCCFWSALWSCCFWSAQMLVGSITRTHADVQEVRTVPETWRRSDVHFLVTHVEEVVDLQDTPHTSVHVWSFSKLWTSHLHPRTSH